MNNRRNTVISNVNVVHKAVLGYKLLGVTARKEESTHIRGTLVEFPSDWEK